MTRGWMLARPLIVIGLAAATLAGCGGDNGGPTGLDPAKFEMVKVSGGGQTGLAGTVLFEPLVVRVRAKDTGVPKEAATVSWSVVQGSGEPTRSSSATDADGLAATRVELRSPAGNVRVEARVNGLPSVSFSLTSVRSPTLESVSPTSADPGDTVDVRVANLPDGLAAEVLFDGVAAEIADRIAGSPSTLRAVVPPPAGVCAADVQRQDVRVRVDGVTTAAKAVDVTVPADPFQVGQVLVIQGTDDVSCALLPAVGGTARYLLVPMSAEFETDARVQLTLGASSLALATVGRTPASAADFRGRLRATERELMRRGLARATPEGGVSLFAEPQLGDERRFWVLNTEPTGSVLDLTSDDFTRVTAVLKFKGPHTLLYVDRQAPANGLTDSDLELLGQVYDRRLYDADVDFFGAPTDLDGNGRVIVLLSPVVNGLTPRNARGVVVGFFFALDLFSRNASGCQNPDTGFSPCQFSNEGELFYGMVPDPNGTFSDARTVQRVKELMPGVMVHETQHMISFRYKAFETGASELETLWLSEGLAHMAEELGGDEVDAAGQTEIANDLYRSNFDRAAFFLQRPDTASLTVVSGPGNLPERGASWLFLRWLGDQYGDFLFRDLTQTALNGVDNVEAQTGEPFFRLFADWAVMLWTEDQAIPGLSDRYQIPKWKLRDLLKLQSTGQYALQPMQRTFADLRGDSVQATMAASSPFYILVDAAGDTNDLQLDLNAGASAGLAILRVE